MRIVPAILTDKLDDFQNMIDIAKGFTDYVQVDFMDGVFVPSKSISLDALMGVKIPLDMEAHLMVKEPNSYLASLKSMGTKKVIFHFEADPDPENVISNIRKLGMEAGLAVNPKTAISEFQSLVPQVGSFLFLSVDPGFYGSPFIPGVLDEIRRFRSQFLSAFIGIDGGISLDNIKKVKAAGVDYACVGSRIFLQPDPKESYEAFLRNSS
ncbi:MAG: ribulose-phosphate 3-epimerase [Thermodesulfobacteriota bacterium]